jgi:hypothetical protein
MTFRIDISPETAGQIRVAFETALEALNDQIKLADDAFEANELETKRTLLEREFEVWQKCLDRCEVFSPFAFGEVGDGN